MTQFETPDDPLALDRQVCFPLYAASNLLTRLHRPALARLGLTYPQYLVMLVLWEGSSQTVGSLGNRLHLDSGTLTPLLKRMERSGMITRRRNIVDERRVEIQLTAKGLCLRGEAASIPQTLAVGLTLTRQELDLLRVTVTNLVTVLGS